MSSLFSFIRKHGAKIDEQLRDGPLGDNLDYIMPSRAFDIATIKVNVQSVAEEFASRPLPNPDNELEDIVPPFEFMWFEWINTNPRTGRKHRIGSLTRRAIGVPPDVLEHELAISKREMGVAAGGIDQKHTFGRDSDQAMFGIFMVMFAEHVDGTARMFGHYRWLANDMGQPICVNGDLWDSDYFSPKMIPAMSKFAILVLESIVRINTDGTTINPPWPTFKPDRHIPTKPNPRRPTSAWHTIHVGQLDTDNAIQSGSSVCREAMDRREHWVRGHRADYRKGKGLFGSIRKLIWVPEHKRGNSELGTIVPEFVIH